MAPISIQFQLDGNAPRTATLPSDFTLADFEQATKELFGEKYWMYTYVCHGKSFDLKDNDEINRLRNLLVPGMTLFMYTRVKGGGMNTMGSKFVDVTNESSMKRVKFGSGGPDWIVARPGLCLEGKCKNGKCEAFEKRVIVNIGLKSFDLNAQKRTLSRCPQCQSFVNPITCGFNKCQWRYEGQIQRDETDEPVPHSIEWRRADDHAYYRFDADAGESVNWVHLILEAKAL